MRLRVYYGDGLWLLDSSNFLKNLLLNCAFIEVIFIEILTIRIRGYNFRMFFGIVCRRIKGAGGRVVGYFFL